MGEPLSEAERQALVLANLGLAGMYANIYRRSGVPYEDLFQAGCLGLAEAAAGFDPGRSDHFGGYAGLYVRRHVQETATGCRGVISIGAKAERSRHKLFRFLESFWREHGREAGDKDVLAAGEFTHQALTNALAAGRAAQSPRSGLKPSHADHALFSTAPCGRPSDELAAEAEEESRRPTLKSFRGLLSARQWAVIRLRYPAKGESPEQEEIAVKLGLNRQQVGRAERSALRAMGAAS